jgi:hypothetical protein
MMDTIPASRSKGPLKKLLMGDGGSAQVRVNGQTRVLSHTFLDRPARKLPWPFNRMQPHNIRFELYDGDGSTGEHLYAKRESVEQIHSAASRGTLLAFAE